MTNCPNCGAPITSYECEYCGTVFDHPRKDIEYVKRRTEKLKQSSYAERLYAEAIKAMKNYACIENERREICKTLSSLSLTT